MFNLKGSYAKTDKCQIKKKNLGNDRAESLRDHLKIHVMPKTEEIASSFMQY
jgi:hypothetical protein